MIFEDRMTWNLPRGVLENEFRIVIVGSWRSLGDIEGHWGVIWGSWGLQGGIWGYEGLNGGYIRYSFAPGIIEGPEQNNFTLENGLIDPKLTSLLFTVYCMHYIMNGKNDILPAGKLPKPGINSPLVLVLDLYGVNLWKSKNGLKSYYFWDNSIP